MKVKILKFFLTFFVVIFALGLVSCVEQTPNQAEYPEKIIILDASASMRTENNGKTRFERAVEDIRTLASDFFQEGGIITLILADDQPEFVAQRISGNDQQLFFSIIDSLLENDACSYGLADIKASLDLSESILEVNSKAEILFYTETEYKDSGNVTVVNVADQNEWNAAILNASTSVVENYYILEVDVASYGCDKTIQINIDVDTYNANQNVTLHYEIDVNCHSNKEFKVVFCDKNLYSDALANPDNTVYYLLDKDEGFNSFQSIFIYIYENDSFIYDNQLYLYGGRKEVVNVQYASSAPNEYVQGTLYSMQDDLQEYWDMRITEIKVGNEPHLSGYNFYIFEETAQTVLPQDGINLLINPTDSIKGVLHIGEKVEGNFSLTFDKTHPISKNLEVDNITIPSYTKITYYDRSFTPIMWCGTDPVLLVKNTGWEKIVILLLDITDLGEEINQTQKSAGFIKSILIDNVFQYFFTPTVVKRIFEIGEEIVINARGEEVDVTFSGNDRFRFTKFPATLKATKPGVCNLQQTTFSGIYLSENIFIRIPALESNIFRTEEVLQLTNGDGDDL